LLTQDDGDAIDAMTDWQAWHDPYGDEMSALSRRLRVVQHEIRHALPAAGGQAFTVVSLCAGQGDDLLGVLRDHPAAPDVHACMVELDERNLTQLRRKVEEAGLAGVDVVAGDAAETALYADSLPADLVLLCGVFGNISDSDVMTTIAAMPQFCSRGATVIWTRSRREPDLTPTVRAGFADLGFTETRFVAPDDVEFSVGVCRYDGDPQPLRPARLFSFLR
jgi:hypothetical protein